MCGINFIICNTNIKLEEPLQTMQEVSKFRGPDAQNNFLKEGAGYKLGLGVNRLQVVDRDERSDQPMKSVCGNYVLAFNGEVYNYPNLKNRLIEKGYRFSTHSDTETILYWLQEYGKDGLVDLKGMFTLVFLDLKKNEFFCTRDHQGIKPLFYYSMNGRLVISSTIPAIEKCGLTKLTLNNAAIDDYLAYRHVRGSHTFYNEIRSIEPGEILSINARVDIEKSTLSKEYSPTDRSLKDDLIDAVALVFESEKTPGLLLSGGVDSTLLLAILEKELGFRGVPTYTLGVGKDRKWAQIASSQYASNHHEIQVNIGILARIEEFLENTDQPIADHGAFATWLVAEEAAKDTNILLSGAGADELYGGYNRHRAYNFYLNNYKTVMAIKRILNKVSLNKVLPTSFKQFSKGIDTDPIRTYQNFLQNYSITKKPEKNLLWNTQGSLMNNLTHALEYDKKNYLINDVLALTDNSTMQHSVEARVPYLYDDIVGHSKSIKIKDKMKSKGKAPLKTLLNEYGGEKYSSRTKIGFGLPMSDWLRDKTSYGLWSFMNSDSPIFAYIPKLGLDEMIRQHQRGVIDHNMQLWSILVLEKWLTRHT